MMNNLLKSIIYTVFAAALSACASQNSPIVKTQTKAVAEKQFELKSQIVASDLHGAWAYTVAEDGVEGINMSVFAPNGQGFDLMHGKDGKGTELTMRQSFTWTFDEKNQLLHEKITELTIQGKKEKLPEPQILKVRILTVKGHEPMIEFTDTQTGEKMAMFRISDHTIRKIITQTKGQAK